MIGVTTFGGDGGKSGVSQYMINLTRELAVAAVPDQFEILSYRDEKRIFIPNEGNLSILRFPDSFRNPILNVAWHQLFLPYWCKKRNYDVLFLPAGNRRLPLWVPCPAVGTVHDFSALHVKGKYDPARDFYIRQVLPRLIRRLTRVITVSESSKRDIVEYARFPEERIHVTPLAADADVYHPRDKASSYQYVQQKYQLTAPYILYISRIEHPGKNHVRLIQAFARLKASRKIPHQLVLAGSDWMGADQVHRIAQESGFTSDIVFTGFVPSQELPDLYCGCDLFVFPSLYEGFGLPLLEAMSCGVPATCSNLSSLPEVAGPDSLRFDPYKEESIAEAIFSILKDEENRLRYAQIGFERSQQFTWKETARLTLEVLHEAAAERISRAGRQITALEPLKSSNQQRIVLMDELEALYGRSGGWTSRLRYWRKKYFWMIAVNGARFIKRCMDIAVSLATIVVLFPLFAITALSIKLTDGGPVFFWQTRVGRWGREFPFPKFRSMRVDAEKIKQTLLAQSDLKDSITFKMKRDPRITWIGRIIRKFSIDELPQLWCVLKGDMSLVGPRPPIPSEVARYTLADRRRLDVTPGLTCIWQVSGRSDIPFKKQVELDVQYIESQSLFTDILLLVKTIPAVLLGKGAY